MDVDKIRQMGLDTIQQAVDLDNARISCHILCCRFSYLLSH